MVTIAVLALQGAYQQQARMLEQLQVAVRFVRQSAELSGCQGLVLPGGESGVMSCLLDANRLRPALLEFARTHPVMGTCAGAILMAQAVNDTRVRPLGLLPMQVERNHYGSQIDSFSSEVALGFDAAPYPAHFIRAPRLIAGDGVEVLARHAGGAVLVRHQHHLAMSFHPELTDNPAIHRYWLSLFHQGE